MNVLKKTFLPMIILLVVYGFYQSAEFKEISAGVAIFLFGMLFLNQGFDTLSGGLLERILKKSTDKTWKSLTFGIVSTTIMQSSSLVSVLTISFLSAGMFSLAAGIGIAFGANIGTTTGAWLIAGLGMKVKLSVYALPMLVLGILLVFQNRDLWKGIGYALAGMGFLFLGIDYMKSGFDAFQGSIDLSAYSVDGIKGLLIYAGLGVVATVIMQSSHATLVLIITALASSQITYDNALALAIGANVGTTITAIIGSIGANYKGKQLAAAHLIFNLTTGLVAILFIQQFMTATDYVSNYAGIAADNYTLKLAVFHTLFNLAGVMIMTPLIGQLVRFLDSVLKEKGEEFLRPKYLNEAALETFSGSLEVVRQEMDRLYDFTKQSIAHGIGWNASDLDSNKSIADLLDTTHEISQDINDVYQNRIKKIYAEIIKFITTAQERERGANAELFREMRVAGFNLISSVKGVKHIQKNLQGGLVSYNSHIQDGYNRMRKSIAEVIRGIQKLRSMDDPEEALVEIDHLRLKVKKDRRHCAEEVATLLSMGKITPEEGISLMNDIDYAKDICDGLIKSSRYLFAKHSKLLDELALAAEEIDEIAEN